MTRSLPEIIKLLRAVKTRIEFFEVYKALIIKLTFLLLTPLVLTLPWSLNLIRNPSRFLLNPGIPVPGGSALSTLLTNPGGLNSLPFWIISPALAFAVVALFSAKSREYGELAVFMIGFALLTNVFLITGNGVSAYFHTWSGSILTLATLSAIFAGINHLCWLLDIKQGNKDLYPLLIDAVNKQAGNKHSEINYEEGIHSPVSGELFRIFGLYPAPGDRHVAEFFQGYLSLKESGELDWGLQGGLNLTEQYIGEKSTLWDDLRAQAEGILPIGKRDNQEAER